MGEAGRIFGALCFALLAACSGDDLRGGPKGSCAACAPDLVLDVERMGQVLAVVDRSFAAASCEVRAGCAREGDRKILPFPLALRNEGDGPLILEEKDLVANRCGEGKALSAFVAWRILDESGSPVRGGTADLPCIADGSPFDPSAKEARFTCEQQGLQPGWLYEADEAPCAFADLSGLRAGAYEIELVADPAGKITEKRSDNNTARFPFEVPLAPCPGDRCGGVCCPEGVACDRGKCAMPDLIIDEVKLRQSIRLDEANFGADDCAVDEGCVAETGLRRLLRFTLSTPNVGGADLFVGDPQSSEHAEYSACHEHFHMAEFASYRLLRLDGTVAAVGHKQAFCLMDTEAHAGDGPTAPRYDCEFQGISRGWSDSYGSGLDCQWVDVTGVPEGEYELEVVVNGAGVYPELDYDNNAVRVPVFLSADPTSCIPREELCGDGRDQNCDGVPDDGCDPLTANDRCEAAHFLDGSGTFTGFIAPAAQAGGSCGGAGGKLHFSLTVLAEEIVYLSTYGSAIDTVLRVNQGSCGAPVEAACVDDACASAQSHFAGALPPGSYDVIVQAKEAQASGEVKLTVQRSGCAGARPIPAPGSYPGDTAGQGADTMTSCGLGGGPDDLFFLATCPGSTELTASTCGSAAFDSVIEVREASCRGRSVACNDDGLAAACNLSGSRLVTTLSGEGLFFLVVDGYLATDGGSYELEVDF